MSKFAVIIPAAGQSSRFGGGTRKKPFVDLKGRPVWVRTAEVFAGMDEVVQTILCVSPEDIEGFKLKFAANLAFMEIEIVEGGKTRAESVENGLARVTDDVDYVAVHDAARPLIVKKWVREVFEAAEKSGAAIPAVPLSSTIKRVDASAITETVDRTGLYAAQTPQVFAKQVLLDAYAKRQGYEATDEAELVERSGHPVTIVNGWAMNLKITTQDDFKMAEALIDALPPEKSLGALHPFSDERFL
ncbi:MAG: 2-C-methyl-D-erythritol 4-phosphate cytidylyltransferase [Planctomycetaceae bacterium]|nr:2-C-methyl-D-erythritol 4-phosphate cytidylyltransferase [Planctomycetaceae bacterium]